MSADVPRPPRKGQEPPAARHLRLVSDKPTPPREKKKRDPAPLFSPEEAARIRAALKHARALLGSWPCLADAMHMDPKHVQGTASGKRPLTGVVAVRLARALGVPLESLYRAPTDAARCPTCGRST